MIIDPFLNIDRFLKPEDAQKMCEKVYSNLHLKKLATKKHPKSIKWKPSR